MALDKAAYDMGREAALIGDYRNPNTHGSDEYYSYLQGYEEKEFELANTHSVVKTERELIGA